MSTTQRSPQFRAPHAVRAVACVIAAATLNDDRNR